MAMILDAVLKIIANVQGGNNIKALSAGMQDVESASVSASNSLQQAANESGRLSQESARSGAAAKLQAIALQYLQLKARTMSAEMRRMSADTMALGSAMQQLSGESGDTFSGLSKSAITGADSISKLKSYLQLTEAEFSQLRNKVLEFGAASNQTRQSVDLQIAALKDLRNQTAANGAAFHALSGDIQRLEARGKAFGQAWEPGIRGLKLLAKTSAETAGQQTRHMTLVEAALAEAGDGYKRLGREIDSLRQKATSLDLSKGLQVTPGNVARGVGGAVQGVVQMRQDLARSMTGRVVLAGEGLAAAGAMGAAGMGAASGLGGMAGGAGALASSLDAIAAKAQALPGVLKPLSGLLSEPAAAAAAGVAQWSASLTAAQAKVAALSAPFEAIGTAISSIGPEASAAAGVASLAIAGVYGVLKRQADSAEADLEASFRGISDASQKLLQDLVRVYDRVPNAKVEAQQRLLEVNRQRLGEVPSDSVEARRAANAVASAEREINKIKAEQNGLIKTAQQQQARAGNELAAQVGVARERLEAQRRLTAETLRTADAERQAQAIRGSVRRQQEQQARDQARADRQQADLAARAAAAYAPSRTLALPAAGSSSFIGAVDGRGMGGGARVNPRFEIAGTRDSIGQAMASRTLQELQEQRQATQRTRGALAELFITIDKVTAASNGSIGSLQRQRAAWTALRNAVNPAAPAYANATEQVKRLDQQLSKLTTTQERRGIGREAVGSALGTLATGGGLQGAAGALAGGLAFSGGAAGLVAGAGVAAVGGAAMQAGQAAAYVQQLNLVKITLAQASTSQGEYNRLLQTARKISSDYALGLKETIGSYAQVAVAARANNLSLSQTETIYRGLVASGVAFGKSQDDLNAITTATVQILSKGKISAEELSGQLGERIPGAVAKFAEATGRSLPELAKALQDGQVSIADFVKFADKSFKDYDEIAKVIGSGPEKAGARLQLALDTAAEAYGGFFQQTGANAQDYFSKIVSNLNNSTEGIKRFATLIVNNMTNVIKAIDFTLAGMEKLTGKFNEVPDSQKNKKNFFSNAYNEYTDNYDKIFPNFAPPVNAYGKDKPSTSQLPDQPAKEDTSAALKDQLALALAQEQTANNTLKTNLALSRNDQVRVALAQKIVEYNKIERDFAADKINKQERSLQILANESNYRSRVNAINRQSQEEAERAAKKTKDEALRLQRDRLQLAASQVDIDAQLFQNTLEIAGFAETEVNAVKLKLDNIKKLNQLEMNAFNLKSQALMLDARENGLAAETVELIVRQRELLLDQQNIRSRSIALQNIELLQAKEANNQENRKQLSAERYQNKSAIAGLQVGIAKSLGRPTGALERALLADQQTQRRQEAQDMAQVIANKEATRASFVASGADIFGSQIDNLNIEIKQLEEILGLRRQQLPIMESLETKQQQLNEFAERYGSIFDAVGQGLTSTFDLLVTGSEKWGESLSKIGSTVLQDIARQLLKIFVIEQTISVIKQVLAPQGPKVPLGTIGENMSKYAPLLNANGNAFGANGIQPFAMGGAFTNSIVNAPTPFRFAAGGAFRAGVMGEAGPEAVMPLQRGRDGRLGVSAASGPAAAPINITIQVDASGTKAQGDQGQAGALARDLAAVVDERLIHHRRPGGLLTR